jgi:ribosomal peptide maturation radical SAM protein 1
VLVNMPFAVVRLPSIQLGLLQALAVRAGHAVSGVYANIEFAKRVGLPLYLTFTRYRGTMIGEWLFSKAAFPEFRRADKFPARFAGQLREIEKETGCTAGELVRLREELAPAFIAELAERLCSDGDTRLIGFTSTFQQNVAALALARSIKARRPDVTILFGGSNYDGKMGVAYFRAFDFIDAIVVGEADEAFLEILDATAEGRPLSNIEGAVTRAQLGTGAVVRRATYEKPMDDLPVPLYDDYLAALRASPAPPAGLSPDSYLLFESSRGCWWGEKHHCTFCGLNDDGLKFRAKSAPAVMNELRELSSRYGWKRMGAVDDILGLHLLEELTGRLIDQQPGYEIFYEIKANLTREQIGRLGKAGFRHVQPGIESLSSPVLKLMDKGIRAIQNVNTLRWLRYYNVRVLWNILCGFPGETAADYETQRRLASLLHHLHPPMYVGRIFLERFSPYYERHAEFGIKEVRPEESYRYVYPEHLNLDDAAYYFTARMGATIPDAEIRAMQEGAQAWRAGWASGTRPFLLFEDDGEGGIRVIDGRDDPDAPVAHAFRGRQAQIYLACVERPVGLHAVGRFVANSRGATTDPEGIRRVLQGFVDRRLLIEEDGLYLSLALPTAQELATVA